MVYGKLNGSPEPDNLDYDVKDDQGQINPESIIYGFEYTPCEFKNDDFVYLKIVGLEGKANITVTASYNILSNYKVFCPEPINQPNLSLYPSVTPTNEGTIVFGGKDMNTGEVLNDLYLLNKESKWEKIPVNGDTSPDARYGAFITYIEDYLIIFAGKNSKDELLNDIWVFDLKNKYWENIIFKNSTDAPSPRFLVSGEVIENFGEIVFFGGNQDPTLYFLNYVILLNLIGKSVDKQTETKIWRTVSLCKFIRIYSNFHL